MIVDLIRKIRDIPVIYRLYINTVGKLIFTKREKRKWENFQKHGKDVLKDLFEIAEQNGIEIVCLFGTLLGVIREQGIIEHDSDIDIGLFDTAQYEKFDRLLIDNGYEKFREIFMQERIVILTYQKASVDIDVYLFDREDDSITAYSVKRYDRPYKTGVYEPYKVLCYRLKKFCDLEIRKIDDFCVKVPEDPEQILEETYGMGWKVPDAHYQSHAPMEKKMFIKEVYFK